MYPYHGRIKQRIAAGEPVDFYFTDSYPKIGMALVLVFRTEPHKRPIRPHRYAEYSAILEKRVSYQSDNKEVTQWESENCEQTEVFRRTSWQKPLAYHGRP